MEYKTGYKFDDEGKVIRIVSVRENPRKKGQFLKAKNVTFKSPPNVKKYEVPIFNGEAWEIHSDYRGEWFHKILGLEVDSLKIDKIDEIPDLSVYTDIPIPFEGGFHYFNVLTQQWEENIISKQIDDTRKVERDLREKLYEINLDRLEFILDSFDGIKIDKKAYDDISIKAKGIRDAYNKVKSEHSALKSSLANKEKI